MRLLKKYREHICEEVEGAQEYAEKYVESKARGESGRASKYREMAYDELKHAETVRDMAFEDMQKLAAVTPLPSEDEEEWNKVNKHCFEEIALVKHMLS
jgi:hypothetical protein